MQYARKPARSLLLLESSFHPQPDGAEMASRRHSQLRQLLEIIVWAYFAALAYSFRQARYVTS